MAHAITLQGGVHQYRIGKKIGETDVFTLYIAEYTTGSGTTQCILKIAAAVECNSVLDREAYLLRYMLDEAAKAEEEFARSKRDPNVFLNLNFQFPNLVESFIAPESQGKRRVNILRFPIATEDLGCMVPLEFITTRDRVRVDPKTSVWIFGKTLKALTFPHDIGISNINVAGENILIVREDHFVTIFDWSSAKLERNPSVHISGREEIAKAARSVIRVLGGDLAKGTLPSDPQLTDTRFQELLFRFARGEVSDPRHAHERFYALCGDLWGAKKFHPYTAYPLT